MPREIRLSRGLVAVVDEKDFASLSACRWMAMPRDQTGAKYYASRAAGRKTIYMHRHILGAAVGQEVDHIDGDGLNNCRSNLRLCDHRLNCVNRRGYNPLSGFRGVYATPLATRWVAKISDGHRKLTHLGTFSSKEEAAVAYDRAASSLYGQFAVLNFPDERNVT